jgi:hypothetical protein
MGINAMCTGMRFLQAMAIAPVMKHIINLAFYCLPHLWFLLLLSWNWHLIIEGFSISKNLKIQSEPVQMQMLPGWHNSEQLLHVTQGPLKTQTVPLQMTFHRPMGKRWLPLSMRLSHLDAMLTLLK